MTCAVSLCVCSVPIVITAPGGARQGFSRSRTAGIPSGFAAAAARGPRRCRAPGPRPGAGPRSRRPAARPAHAGVCVSSAGRVPGQGDREGSGSGQPGQAKMASAGGSLEEDDGQCRTSIVPPRPRLPSADTPDTSPAAMKQQLTASFHDFAVSLRQDQSSDSPRNARVLGVPRARPHGSPRTVRADYGGYRSTRSGSADIACMPCCGRTTQVSKPLAWGCECRSHYDVNDIHVAACATAAEGYAGMDQPDELVGSTR